ncbi:MAG: hypothetical protein JWQ81_7495 [Amycolatopsis sp.]|nr:hypothetical protein [Amycolatopsis sp.]
MGRSVTAVNDLADELVGLWFTADPVLRSFFGLPGDHDRLADLSAAAEAQIRAAYVGLASRAEALEGLSPGDAVTRDVVVGQARVAVDLIDGRALEFAVSDGFSAPALQIFLFLSDLKLGDEQKAAGYLARLAAIPSYLDTVADRQRAGCADGLVPPAFLVDAGIAYIERYLAAPHSDPLRLDAVGAGESYADERDRLLADVVRPAYAKYRDFLAAELKPHGQPEDKPGMCWLPGGDEKYAGLIRAHTTTDRTAQDLHDTGVGIIARLAGEYRELGERTFGTTDLGEIFDRLRTDPELRWTSGEELLDSARETIARAEAAAPQWFSRIPDQSCVVTSVPEAEAPGGTLAYYNPPALDGSRGGTYFANTYQAEERSRHLSEAVAFHEAVPGHHFQLCVAQGLTELPLARRIGEFTAYAEGWGLYAERLADEMGLYSDGIARFGLLTQDSMRAGRLVVDTGLHALGWSRQRAVDYLVENTPMAKVEIDAEIDRYIACPGQALAYMVGRLEIERNRAKAEQALGDRFDIKAFHDLVLGGGALPLSVLDTVVSDWVTGLA